MENTPSNENTGFPKTQTTESVLYVHGRRIIITLIVVLLIIGIVGVLYYNGKFVYENGV